MRSKASSNADMNPIADLFRGSKEKVNIRPKVNLFSPFQPFGPEKIDFFGKNAKKIRSK